ncbi:MAG: hypothetical protein PUD79_08065 [Prevotellaceae bacterium]|nr:hypothetical protein [Prevotellaceae bacterium]
MAYWGICRSLDTVKKYKHSLLLKLGVTNTPEAITYALSHNIIY